MQSTSLNIAELPGPAAECLITFLHNSILSLSRFDHFINPQTIVMQLSNNVPAGPELADSYKLGIFFLNSISF